MAWFAFLFLSSCLSPSFLLVWAWFQISLCVVCVLAERLRGEKNEEWFWLVLASFAFNDSSLSLFPCIMAETYIGGEFVCHFFFSFYHFACKNQIGIYYTSFLVLVVLPKPCIIWLFCWVVLLKVKKCRLKTNLSLSFLVVLDGQD